MSQSNPKTSSNIQPQNPPNNLWWGELRHGGLLISPAVLDEMYPDGIAVAVNESPLTKLKDAYLQFITSLDDHTPQAKKDRSSALLRWVDAIFEGFLDLPTNSWVKESQIPKELKIPNSLGEILFPNRALFHNTQPRYLLKIDKTHLANPNARLGIGKSKQVYAKFLELLRKTKIQLGVITNGHQVRLVYAGLDHDSWIEWDTTQWFGEQNGAILLAAFLSLCGREMNFAEVEGKWSLLHFVQYSRIKQGDLSSVLSTQVRETVELLLKALDLSARDHSTLMDPLLSAGLQQKQLLDALYQAAIRLIMRLVVIFFAEARDLFPRSLAKYDQSYGLEGLFRLLTAARQDEGEENLKNSTMAWARLLSLFRLIYDGSPFSDIPLRPYGGILFRSGNPTCSDPILRAISIFENPALRVNDHLVLEILRKLKIGKIKVKQGRSSRWVSGVVDFSELSAEYIGMMYEGLLDYQVRQVSADEEAIVILRLGKQPALPLTRLEGLADKDLKNLIEKLSKEKTIQVIKEDEGEGDEEDDEEVDFEEEGGEEENEDENDVEESDVDEDISDSDSNEEFTTDRLQLFQRTLEWAKRAVIVSKLIKKTKKMSEEAFQAALDQKAKTFVSLNGIYAQGQYYVIQNSGNRKGSGTFYTKPQLVIPTVQRTIEPLVYTEDDQGIKIPISPEKILELKVLDPAMGSASFLVAALRYLADVLYESLLHYGKINSNNDSKTIISIPLGKDAEGKLKDDTFTILAVETNELAERQIKARLKRHIMEYCIYGVDINPLAVELAKLSLWVETLDRDLPFNFIDHKLKVGNSMIGASLRNTLDYPLNAWVREAGDSTHTKGIKYKKGEWTALIKDFKDTTIKQEMRIFIEKLKGITEITDYFNGFEKRSKSTQLQILQNYRMLHQSDRFDITKVDDILKKETFYLENFQNNSEIREIRDRMDLWCSLWFWDPDKLEICPTPLTFLEPTSDMLTEIQALTKKYKFFHWEIEYPDVFLVENPGFNVVLGNPPWETFQASSMEYFSEFDPIYRTYGNEKATDVQKGFFTDNASLEREWLLYSSFYKFYKNWVSYLSNPFGDYLVGDHFNIMDKGGQHKKSKEYHDAWRNYRKKQKSNLFELQGKGKIYTYKIFLEISFKLLSHNGRFGMICPSSIYGDLGSQDMREYFIENTKWDILFSFENRNKIFASVDGRFKFCILIVENKNIKQNLIKTGFMKTDLSEWMDLNQIIDIKKTDLLEFSPYYKIFLEFSNFFDLQLCKKILQNGEFLRNSKFFNISYSRELNSTNSVKKKIISKITNCLNEGFIEDDYFVWKNGLKEAYPVYEGTMIGQYDYSKKKWEMGTGRTAKWVLQENFDGKIIKPQFLIQDISFKENNVINLGYKVSYIKISASTNQRTMIGFLTRNTAHLDKAPVLCTKIRDLDTNCLLLSTINSFVFDYYIRFRITKTDIDYYKIEEAPVPKFDKINNEIKLKLIDLVIRLSFTHIHYSPEWIRLKNKKLKQKCKWKMLWAVTNYERLRIRSTIEAIIAFLYRLNFEDLKMILNPSRKNPRGFWRVDKDKPEEIRLTSLILKAYEELLKLGIDKFIETEWQIPEEIQEKYKGELGPQYLDWQLEGTVEESWAECEQHTKKILGDEKYTEFSKLLDEGRDPFAIWAIEKEKERQEAFKTNKKQSSKKSKSKKKSTKISAKTTKRSINPPSSNPNQQKPKTKPKDLGDFMK